MQHAEALSKPSPALPTKPSTRSLGLLEPPWLGGLQDLRREHVFEPLRVEGVLPAALEGVLFRNGPGRFTVGGGQRAPHWFDADGAVSSVRLAGGRAWGAVRVVRTTGLEREERAGKRLFGGYGTPLVRPVREMLLGDTKNPANTSVMTWQGRLFATCEAGKPYELDPASLSTYGESLLGGALAGPFSAHPHRVPQRRATYNFGMAHGRATRVDAYELPDEGAARRIATFDLDGARLCHDFAATPRHLVFAIAPLFVSLVQTMLLGKPPIASARWKRAHGTDLVVVPIDAPDRIRRFRVEAFLLEHIVNAFEEGDTLVVDYTHYDDADGLERYVGGLTSGRIDAPLRSELRRMRIRPQRDVLESEVVLRRAVELPRVSPRVDAARHRHVYCVDFANGAAGAPFQPLLKLDAGTGRVETYDPGSHRYVGEGVFVPRPDGSGEDDGWVLAMTYDAGGDRSTLEILDARAFGDGPIAACHFDQPIPLGFHGTWAPAA
jgi:all-trans-8'-apo-beta-carotenal 15,15'-oxygenase